MHGCHAICQGPTTLDGEMACRIIVLVSQWLSHDEINMS